MKLDERTKLDFHVVEVVRFRITCKRCAVQSKPLRQHSVKKWIEDHRKNCVRRGR